MPLPGGPSEEQVSQGIRDKQFYRHLRYKAACLVTVGIGVNLEPGKGYPFWYTINYLNVNPNIKNPAPEIKEQGHTDWQAWYKNKASELTGKSFDDPTGSVFYVKKGPHKGKKFTDANELYKWIEDGKIQQEDVYEDRTTEEHHAEITDKTMQLLRESPLFFSEANPDRPDLVRDFDYEVKYTEIDYPTWLRSKKPLVPRTSINHYFNPETDLQPGEDVAEARLRLIAAVTRAIRNIFWTIRIPTPRTDPNADRFFNKFVDIGSPNIEDNWLHKQIVNRLASAIAKVMRSAQYLGPVGVGVIYPRGIEEIFENEKQALDAINNVSQEHLVAAALVRIGNFLDEKGQVTDADLTDKLLKSFTKRL